MSQLSGASLLAPGFKLDRYELLCPIAEGGTASVWIARQTGKHGFEKLVAVKTILPKFASDARFRSVFQDEARIASRIEHANVAQILDVGEQHDIIYLVMEYVDGEALSTLHRVLQKKGLPIPPGILLRIMADVCGGLHAAHELRSADGQSLGVVHRDVSPQSVLVSMKGIAKLVDFGIAKARDGAAEDTGAVTLKGKLRYMAPEQALGLALDRRADVWAVGAILYHLLSGKPPYDGDNDVQALAMLTSGRAPAPLPDVVSPPVARLVERALACAPEKRFATTAELEQAIENAMVEAQLGTNVSTVSACLQEHVGTRARKRKEAISLGVNAASERALREDYVVLIPTSAAGAVEAPSSGTSDHEAVPASTDSGEAASTGSASSARIGETPGSSATVVPAPRASHGKLFALVGATAGAGAGIVGVVMLVNREQPLARPGAALDVAPPAVTTSASGETGVEASAIAVTVTEGPTPGTGATEPPNLPPAIAVTDLPPAPPLPPAVGAPATPSALVIPMRTTSRPLSSARPTRQIKPRVNDGF